MTIHLPTIALANGLILFSTVDPINIVMTLLSPRLLSSFFEIVPSFASTLPPLCTSSSTSSYSPMDKLYKYTMVSNLRCFFAFVSGNSEGFSERYIDLQREQVWVCVYRQHRSHKKTKPSTNSLSNLISVYNGI